MCVLLKAKIPTCISGVLGFVLCQAVVDTEDGPHTRSVENQVYRQLTSDREYKCSWKSKERRTLRNEIVKYNLQGAKDLRLFLKGSVKKLAKKERELMAMDNSVVIAEGVAG